MRIFANTLICIIVLHLNAALAIDLTSSDLEQKNLNMIPYGVIDDEIAKVAYGGNEYFRYDVSWTGGIKIGEMYQELEQPSDCDDCFTIKSTITTSGGIIHLLYPVVDKHVTQVKGSQRLPFHAEIWQKEGRSYSAHKIFKFDQQQFVLTKEKNGDSIRTYRFNGVVHNEFSSFFSSRVMDLYVGNRFIVPTFGDDMRREVVVEVAGEEIVKDTLLGDVKTLRVTPILTFSGLYDKQGDTIIWYTDDECRVPVEIQSKIIVGSLTARLVEYFNPRCDRYLATSIDN